MTISLEEVRKKGVPQDFRDLQGGLRHHRNKHDIDKYINLKLKN
jgi:hypothetical protein